MTPFFEWRDAPAGDFAVIGDPVSHSLSPIMQTAGISALGYDFSYLAIRVPAGEVKEALGHLQTLGYRGINVTVPLKAEALDALEGPDPFSLRCGALNTIDLPRMEGINTDGYGFLDTLPGLVPSGSNVLLLGAGGSARAIALALALGGYNLRIFNRTAERAFSLVRELAIEAAVVDSPALQDVHLIVNATSASLHGAQLPVAFHEARPEAVAYDLVYGDTLFLQSASEAGLKTIDGKSLLVAQGARSLEFWLGGAAPRDVMLEAIQ